MTLANLTKDDDVLLPFMEKDQFEYEQFELTNNKIQHTSAIHTTIPDN